MTVDRSRHVRILVTLPLSMRSAIADYAARASAPSESAAIRSLIADALARDVADRVGASVGEGIASPQPRPRDPG